MNVLLKFAWPLLFVAFIVEATGRQFFYLDLSGYSFSNRIAFAIGGILGDMPALLLVAVVFLLTARFALHRPMNARLYVLSLAVGLLATAIIIHPLFFATFA